MATKIRYSFNKRLVSNIRYGPLGALVTWVTGIIVSYLTGGQDITESNLSLLAPCIQNLLPQKYHHAQLQVITEKPPLEPEEQVSEKTQLNTAEVVGK